ncbi:unnamed protein product [Oppiella nova]|uniref:Protein kinase domain-containing protein n=1 Tax=Oppiella nova TaxID=334625 RepID=A0A7R9QMV3_9ACAR|nr:unnamed protein product [Oppiella nova]CAG2169070.1 unnamed protein product [Oppiella nova]
MSKVQSKYCVEYYDSWLEMDYYYIQMELCAHSLKNILEHKHQEFDRDKLHSMNSYEYFISCEIFREILECVQYLHEMKTPIIHRDLNPANILISESAKSGRFIKLCDFGLATIHNKSINNMKSKHTGGDVGTIGFIAPEVFKSKPYSHKCDIYSLAIIGTELFEFDLDTFDMDNPQPYSSHNANLNDPTRVKVQVPVHILHSQLGALWHISPVQFLTCLYKILTLGTGIADVGASGAVHPLPVNGLPFIFQTNVLDKLTNSAAIEHKNLGLRSERRVTIPFRKLIDEFLNMNLILAVTTTLDHFIVTMAYKHDNQGILFELLS